MIDNDEFMLKGMKEICRVAKAPEAKILFWIRELGFPAWKAPGETAWRAFPQDIYDWFKHISARQLTD